MANLNPFSTTNALSQIISPKIVTNSSGFNVAVDLVDIDTAYSRQIGSPTNRVDTIYATNINATSYATAPPLFDFLVTGSTGISVNTTGPNLVGTTYVTSFNISNTAVASVTGGTGIGVTRAGNTFTVFSSVVPQAISLTGGPGISVTSSGSAYTITSTSNITGGPGINVTPSGGNYVVSIAGGIPTSLAYFTAGGVSSSTRLSFDGYRLNGPALTAHDAGIPSSGYLTTSAGLTCTYLQSSKFLSNGSTSLLRLGGFGPIGPALTDFDVSRGTVTINPTGSYPFANKPIGTTGTTGIAFSSVSGSYNFAPGPYKYNIYVWGGGGNSNINNVTGGAGGFVSLSGLTSGNPGNYTNGQFGITFISWALLPTATGGGSALAVYSRDGVGQQFTLGIAPGGGGAGSSTAGAAYGEPGATLYGQGRSASAGTPGGGGTSYNISTLNGGQEESVGAGNGGGGAGAFGGGAGTLSGGGGAGSALVLSSGIYIGAVRQGPGGPFPYTGNFYNYGGLYGFGGNGGPGGSPLIVVEQEGYTGAPTPVLISNGNVTINGDLKVNGSVVTTSAGPVTSMTFTSVNLSGTAVNLTATVGSQQLNTVTATSLTVGGTVIGSTGVSTASITNGNILLNGNTVSSIGVSAVNITASGTVTTNNLNASGNAVVTGSITSNNGGLTVNNGGLTVSGAMTGASLSTTGGITGSTISTSGTGTIGATLRVPTNAIVANDYQGLTGGPAFFSRGIQPGTPFIYDRLTTINEINVGTNLFVAGALYGGVNTAPNVPFLPMGLKSRGNVVLENNSYIHMPDFLTGGSGLQGSFRGSFVINGGGAQILITNTQIRSFTSGTRLIAIGTDVGASALFFLNANSIATPSNFIVFINRQTGTNSTEIIANISNGSFPDPYASGISFIWPAFSAPPFPVTVYYIISFLM